MNHQVAFPRKTLSALKTRDGSLFGVNSYVILKEFVLGETQSTLRACEQLLSVNLHMHIKVSFVGEALSTVMTLEGLFSSVKLHMSVQV